MNKRKKVYRICLMTAIIVSVLVIFGVMYTDLYRDTPNIITIKTGDTRNISIHAPLSGKIYKKTTSEQVETMNQSALAVNFGKTVTFHANHADSYVAEVKLFGIIPFKDIRIEVIDDIKLIPAGVTIGIYVETKGILIVDVGEFESTDGLTYSPSENILKTGDYILEANQEVLNTNQELIRIVEQSEGKEVILKVRRGEEEIMLQVTPVKNTAGEFKMGIWVKDSAQGIGTLTYVNTDQTFGALGHGINDNDTGILMELGHGSLYNTEIIGITKGEDGKPGEISGMIRYTENNAIGSVEFNTDIGIYGTIQPATINKLTMEPLYIATKQEIEIGPAQILCSVDGEPKLYDIEITAMNEDKSVNRELSIEVTDQKLIDLTGGIIQGMSGSPIIQKNRLVGAVTHVLVKNATKGYGICIENMLFLR